MCGKSALLIESSVKLMPLRSYPASLTADIHMKVSSVFQKFSEVLHNVFSIYIPTLGDVHKLLWGF